MPSIRGLSKDEKAILKGVSVAVKNGEAVSVVGPSGAGKTTMIRLLSGEKGPDSGEAWLDGAPVGSFSTRGSLGLCPQEDCLYPNLTPRQHFEIYALVKGVPAADVEALVQAIATPIDLDQHLDTRSSKLSGGNKRKLGLASALFGLPPAIVADEVSTGVDPGARRGIWEVMAKCRHGSSMIWSTHSMEEAESTGDRVMIMSKGRILAMDTPQRLVQQLGRGLVIDMVISEPTGPNGAHARASSGAGSSSRRPRGSASEPSQAPAKPATDVELGGAGAVSQGPDGLEVQRDGGQAMERSVAAVMHAFQSGVRRLDPPRP